MLSAIGFYLWWKKRNARLSRKTRDVFTGVSLEQQIR